MQNITCSTTNVLHCDSLWRGKQKRVTESCQFKIIIKKQKCAAYKFVKALIHYVLKLSNNSKSLSVINSKT